MTDSQKSLLTVVNMLILINIYSFSRDLPDFYLMLSGKVSNLELIFLEPTVTMLHLFWETL